MEEIGLDFAKNTYQVHGAGHKGHPILRKKMRRGLVLEYFITLPRRVVAMEVCASAHCWGREICRLGHEVWLVPPAFVKPFVKQQKNEILSQISLRVVYTKLEMRLSRQLDKLLELTESGRELTFADHVDHFYACQDRCG